MQTESRSPKSSDPRGRAGTWLLAAMAAALALGSGPARATDVSQLVCDEPTVQRAPILPSDASSEAQHPPELFSGNSILDEASLLSFLLDNTTIWSGFGKKPAAGMPLLGLKRALSLEICKAGVIPGALDKLFRDRPGLFMPLETRHVPWPDATARGELAGEVEWVLRDASGRFGRRDGKWWLAGWVDGTEVISARFGSRIYWKLSQPVTHAVEQVIVAALVPDPELGPIPVPLGTLTPSRTAPATDLKELNAEANRPEAIAQRAEAYRLLLQDAAYRAVGRHRSPHSEKVDALRQALEVALAEVSAPGKSRAGRIPLPAEVRRIFDSRFFSALGQAGVNGAHIVFRPFSPDSKLQGLYREFISLCSRGT